MAYGYRFFRFWIFSLEKVRTYIANRIVFAVIPSLAVYKILKRCRAFIYRLYSVFRKIRRNQLMTYYEQVKKFKKMIPIGVKSTSELIDFLKSKVDVEEISFDDFPYYNLQMLTNNAVHCIQNMELQIKPEDMLFRIFRVIKNEKSDKYCEANSKDFMFVVIEEHTKYICSNSNRLFVEIDLASGISQDEYNNEGLLFRSLISHMAIASGEGYL